MKIDIDINKFISKYNVKPVTSSRPYENKGKLDPNGLFSEDVFGRLGSRERRKTYGYIPLKCKIVHPEAFEIVSSIDVSLSKILLSKEYFSIDSKGNLNKEDNRTGKTGVLFFSQIADKINWDNFKKNPKATEYVKNNLDKILIDKQILLPAGIRDIQILKETNQTRIQFADINILYESMIRQVNNIVGDIIMMPEEIASAIIQSIQRTSLDINFWIQSRLKGKTGVIRGGLLRKTIDYSARLVVGGDPHLKLGYVGLPWQKILKLYEPFAIHHLYKKDPSALPMIQSIMSLDEKPDYNEIKRFFGKINENPDICTEPLKDILRDIAKQIAENKIVLYKRDPTENRDSWLAAYIRVDNDGYVLKLNPLDLVRTGGD